MVLSEPQLAEISQRLMNEFREPQLKVIHNRLAEKALEAKIIDPETFIFIKDTVYPYAEWNNKSVRDRYLVFCLVDEIRKILL